MKRRDLAPIAVGEAGSSPDDVLAHLRAWRADTLDAIQALGSCRQRAEESARQLESPRAVLEYIDYFVELFTRTAADLERTTAELPEGLQQGHLDALRQIASNAAAEQRRCLLFRDKWINRPLPYEQVRPLLNQISSATRDQLADHRELNVAATRLEALAGPQGVPPGASRTYGRRQLFNRLIRRGPDAGDSQA